MPHVEITASTVTVRLAVLEKLAGVLRDLSVPVTAVQQAQVVPDGLRAARGLRAPGLHLPGVTKYGTWRGRRGRTFVAVNRRGPALVLHLKGQLYERVIVSTDVAETLAARVRQT
jgi:hypothetical protein